MNSNAFLTHVEIVMVSALTSAMSGINHLRSRFENLGSISSNAISKPDFGQSLLEDPVEKGPIALTWETFKAFLPPLFLWIILGFAAGFLIGMLKPG